MGINWLRRVNTYLFRGGDHWGKEGGIGLITFKRSKYLFLMWDDGEGYLINIVKIYSDMLLFIQAISTLLVWHHTS